MVFVDGDILWNRSFGDVWVVQGSEVVLFFEGKKQHSEPLEHFNEGVIVDFEKIGEWKGDC